MTKRRVHTPEFKAKIAVEALSSTKTLAEVAAEHKLHPVQVCQWKRQALRQLPSAFYSASTTQPATDKNASRRLSELERANSALLKEVDWLKKNFSKYNQETLRALLEPGHRHISLRRQCELIGVTRSSFYYRPRSLSTKSKIAAPLLDHLCSVNPGISSRRLLAKLHEEGLILCKGHLERLLLRLGFAPFERSSRILLDPVLEVVPSLPVLLESATLEGEQWILDINYWPSPRADLFAAVVVDSLTGKCLAWGLSNSLTADLPIRVMQGALEKHGVPFILRCETFLPYLNPVFLLQMQQGGIGLVSPLWLDQRKGVGRATTLGPIWQILKQWAEAMRFRHPEASEEWITGSVIHQHNHITSCSSRLGLTISGVQSVQ